eukprot:SAG25_NODE_11395_length_305_cov_1.000000_1_plen_29_part_10
MCSEGTYTERGQILCHGCASGKYDHDSDA